ncbi:MAG: hypothetical protein ABL962_00825 [Fimbriimonadaceae bacterium]
MIALFIGYQIGMWRGIGKELRREAERDTFTLFTLLKEDGKDLIRTLNLVDEQTLERISTQEKKHGRIASFALGKSWTGPALLPVLISINVRRERGDFRETMVRHSSSSRRLEILD